MKKFLVSIVLFVTFIVSGASIANAQTYFDHNLWQADRGDSFSAVLYCDNYDGIIYSNLDGAGIYRTVTNAGINRYRFDFYVSDNAVLGTHALCAIPQDGSETAMLYVFVTSGDVPRLYYYGKTSTGITIDWTATDVKRYEVQYRIKGGTWKTAHEFTSKTKTTIKNLKKGKTYQFRVRSVNYDYDWGEYVGDWSNIITKKF